MKQRSKIFPELLKNYPEFFKYHKDPTKSLMGFGCEHDSGWDKIVLELTKKLYALAKKQKIDIEVVQIKEKFGGLRYYVEGGASSEMNLLISKYEDMSYETCEICGKKGECNQENPWVKTVCKKHWSPKEWRN